jgi:hypothetical protein
MSRPVLDLSRGQIRLVAGTLDVLSERAGSRGKVARGLKIGRRTLDKIAARPGRLTLLRETLAVVAIAAGVTIEELLVGKIGVPPAAPATMEQPVCGACNGTRVLTNIIDCEDPSCDCCGAHACSAPCPRCAMPLHGSAQA